MDWNSEDSYNNNHYGYGGNDNHTHDNGETQNSGIDDLFNDNDTNDDTHEDNSFTAGEAGVDTSEVEDHEDDTQDDEQLERLEDVSENLFNAPKNASVAEKFSEKDVYQIINTTMVIDSMTDDQKKLIDSLLSLGGDDIRRSMKIVEMGIEEVDDKVASVRILGMIKEISDDTSAGTDSITKLLNVLKTVGDLEQKERNSLINLSRRIRKNNTTGKSSSFRVNKNSSDVEVVEGIRDLIMENPGVNDSIREMSLCVHAIKEAMS